MISWWALSAAADCPRPLAVAEALGAEDTGDCAFVDLEVSARGYQEWPEIGVSRGVTLNRARAEVGLRVRDIQVRAATLAARSGGEQGYIGVDGESFVPVVQVADVRYDVPAIGLAVAAGLVDDPWVMTLEPAWGHPEIVLPLVTDQGYLDRSDVGGFVSWSAPRSVVAATMAVTSGEGLSRRERNNGVDVTGVIHIRPAGPEPARVVPELAVFARAGSRGIGGAPDHRGGAAFILTNRYVVGGAEAVLGWGLQADGSRRPLGVSAWVRSGAEAPLVALARLDVARDDRSSPEAEETLYLVAGGVRLPWADGPLSAVVGWEGRRYGADARPIAGAVALDTIDVVFVQLSGRIGRSTPLGSTSSEVSAE